MRLCAIGCGEHAESSHGPSQARYAAGHPGVALVACCDRERTRAEAYRARFGYQRAYDDAFQMMETEGPDAVVLVVPETLTAALAIRILEKGVPLLLEKPPGRTPDEVDAMAAAAERGGKPGRPVPHQVAFNRRFVPLVRALHRLLRAFGEPPRIQHLHYEMTRSGRRDPDFSTTAVHGIDAVRFLAGADYAHVRFRYHERPDLGPGVADIFLDGILTSGATAHLAFSPMAGVVVERATVHADGQTFFLKIPMWGAVDSPGSLEHFEAGRLVERISGGQEGPQEAYALGGFYDEYVAFLGDLAAGRTPSPSLRQSRQSVEIAEQIRLRRSEFQR